MTGMLSLGEERLVLNCSIDLSATVAAAGHGQMKHRPSPRTP